MQELLRNINAVVGVSGSFVCSTDGEVLASVLPGTLDHAMLSVVARTAAQTMAGLQTVRKRKIKDIDLLFAEGRVIVRGLRGGSLCILCAQRVNVPLVNLTADVAAKKIAARLHERAQGQAEVESRAQAQVAPVPAPAVQSEDIPRPERAGHISSFLRPFGR